MNHKKINLRFGNIYIEHGAAQKLRNMDGWQREGYLKTLGREMKDPALMQVAEGDYSKIYATSVDENMVFISGDQDVSLLHDGFNLSFDTHKKHDLKAQKAQINELIKTFIHRMKYNTEIHHLADTSFFNIKLGDQDRETLAAVCSLPPQTPLQALLYHIEKIRRASMVTKLKPQEIILIFNKVFNDEFDRMHEAYQLGAELNTPWSELKKMRQPG